MATTTKLLYRPHGGAADLFRCRDAEILIEGPAGTGKTRAVLELIYYLCITFPGIRVLLLRQTRASLTESVLVTWEEKVLWDGHPCLSGKASMENRRSYTFPRASNVVHGVRYTGRSHVVPAGLDKPSRTFSQEYDVVALFEAIEVMDVGVWELLQRCCRNGAMPYQMAIADTNPGPVNHWANQRASQPLVREASVAKVLGEPRPGQTQMTRIKSRHEDNPYIFDHAAGHWNAVGAAYIGKLDGMTGPRYLRMRLGEWVAEAGLIWPLDKSRHFCAYQLDSDSPLRRTELPVHRRDPSGALIFDWYFAAQDWGMRDAGCLQVWGVDDTRSAMYRVAEVYFTEKPLSWWAARLKELHRRFELRKLFYDPSRKDLGLFYAQILQDVPGMELSMIPEKAVNDRDAGIQVVRDMIDGSPLDGKPSIFWVLDAFPYGRDEALADGMKPTCSEQEAENWIWRKPEPGKDIKEAPAAGLADHGLDTTRYAAMGFRGLNASLAETAEDLERPLFDAGTIGDVLGHGKKWERIKAREAGQDDWSDADDFETLGDVI